MDQSGATINGTLEVDESDSAHIGTKLFPLASVTLQFLSSEQYRVDGVTTADGHFQIAGLPSGTYTANPQLPDDLRLNDNPPSTIRVLPGGCGTLRLRAVPNGHVRGVLTTWDGLPADFQNVSLLPAELTPAEGDRYFQSVRTDGDGRFAFEGVRPGRYLNGRLAFVLDRVPIPPLRISRHVQSAGGHGSRGRPHVPDEDVGEFRIPLGGTLIGNPDLGRDGDLRSVSGGEIRPAGHQLAIWMAALTFESSGPVGRFLLPSSISISAFLIE